jgi:hypothetical protein
LAQLSDDGRLEFVVGCARRLLPEYRAFAQARGLERPDALERFFAMATVKTPRLSQDGLRRLQAGIDALMPGDEDAGYLRNTYADFAVIALEYVVEALRSPTIQIAVHAASDAYDAADAKAQTAFDTPTFSGLESVLIAAPSVQDELRAQAQDLASAVRTDR